MTKQSTRNPEFNSKLRMWLLVSAVFCTLLLIYASIVPLKYTPLDWDQTCDRWKKIQWLQLGVYNRADWIANALVVIPSAFFFTGAIDAGRRTRWPLIFASPLIVLFLAAVVLGIELVQVWFPPRTVSQNDIFAGWAGTLFGVSGWFLFGNRLVNLGNQFYSSDSTECRVRLLMGCLCLLGVIHSVWPLDFVVNTDELKSKFEMGRFVLVPKFGSLTYLWNWKGLINESLKMACFGIWMGLRKSKNHQILTLLLISVILEIIQIPVYSRSFDISQIFAGFLASATALWFTRSRRTWLPVIDRTYFWGFAIFIWSIALFYLFNIGYKTIVTDPEEILQRWRMFLVPPFLRYYYTSEFRALSNILSKLLLFAPIGIFFSLFDEKKRHHGKSTVWGTTWFYVGLLWTTLLGCIIEIAQVYVKPSYPDITHIMIATTAYLVGYALIKTLNIAPTPSTQKKHKQSLDSKVD